MIDTHCHLTDSRFTSDSGAVLERARQAGVTQIVAPGVTAADSQQALGLSESHLGVHPAVAIHPNNWSEAQAGDWERIKFLATQPAVVAIGETGLDRYWDRTPFPQQVEAFTRHLDLAESLGLPVIIHARDCFADVIEILSGRSRPVRGVLHSFTGTADDAETLLGLGLHISFAGMITFMNKSLDPLREVAAMVPLNRLLLETDAPYLAPQPHRGRRNEPGFVALTAVAVAKARGLVLEDLDRATTDNAQILFNLTQRSTLPSV